MNLLIQYPLSENSWSDWVSCHIENGKFIVNEQELDVPYVRALNNENLDNPHVCWYIWHNNELYQINKNNRNMINKATPVDKNKSLEPMGIEKLSGDFSLKAFNDMLISAQEHLQSPVITLDEIAEMMRRPADAVQTMNLMAAATAEETTQDWWKDLYERYRREVERELMDILAHPMTRKAQIERLQHFLAEHHRFIQGTCLDYVAIPNHPVTRTLSEIATRLANNERSAIEILMPGVAVESMKDDYQDLSKIPLSEALQSHIVLTPQYLMPVKCLKEWVAASTEKLYSPYCFADCRPYLATPADIQAMFAHSETTQHLRDAFDAYQVLRTQRNTLLGQLNILGSKLKLYDAHGGIGQGESAAGGAYPAIMNFMQYYLNLESCGLILSENPPDLKDLPEGHHLGYAFYQDSLYFLNGYGKKVKLITQPNHSAK